MAGPEQHLHVTPTEIPHLDEILGGGIPDGHVVLLSGDSGTGKTILSTQWLFATAAEDSVGLYLSMTESVTDINRNLDRMSYYRDGAAQNHVQFADLRSSMNIIGIEDRITSKDETEELIDVICTLIDDTGASRVVLDSITALAYMIDDKALLRHFIFRLGTELSRIDCTIIMTSEVKGDSYSVYGVEEFISDAIIKLRHDNDYDDLRRSLQVIKMRGIDPDTKKYYFDITDAGVDLYHPDYELEYPAPTERVSTGIAGIDDMISGGVYRGSATMVAGPTGAGKTLTGLHFSDEGVRNGENCLYVSFEESEDQLERMAAYFDFDIHGNDQFCVYHASPRGAYPEKMLHELVELLDQYDIDRVVIDSLTSLRDQYSDRDFHTFVQELTHAQKSRSITALYISSHEKFIGTTTAAQSRIAPVIDNVLLLNYVEVEARLDYTLTVLKTRSEHDRALRSYRITKNGIHIGHRMSAYEGIMSGSAKKIGKTTSEQIRSVFLDVMGPMGETEFEQLGSDVDGDAIMAYIDSLHDTGVLDADETEEFKQRVNDIINESAV